MSHVDDGILHALLDGALAAADPAEAERVELHLGACADCRARLNEAARLRDEAGALLQGAQPRVVATPPFEEIRARARALDPQSSKPAVAPGRRRALLTSPFNGVAWAATVVLAVGLGWLLRATVDQPERIAVTDMSEEAQPYAEASPEPVESVDLSLAGELPAPEAGSAVPAQRGAPAGGDGSAAAQASRSEDAVLERTATQGFQAVSPPPPPALAQARPAEYDVAEEATEPGATAGAAAGAPAPAAPPPAAAAAPEAALADGWRPSTPDAASRLAGEIIRIEGAELVSAATRATGSGVEVRTVQMTGRGELVTVVQRRPPPERRLSAQRAESQRSDAGVTADAAEAPTTESAPAVTVQAGDWVVTISGAMPRERLEQIANGIR